MRKISEADVEDYLVARVKALGGEVRKVKWIGRSKAPDRVVMLPRLDQPATVWVEVKAPDADQNTAHCRAQRREHKRMRKAGQTVYVVSTFVMVDVLWPLEKQS